MVLRKSLIAGFVTAMVVLVACTSANAQEATDSAVVDATARLATCEARNLPLADDPNQYVPWSAYPPSFQTRWHDRLLGELYVKGWLTSAGMYGNDPADVHDAFMSVAQDIIGYRSAQGSTAVAHLAYALEQAHGTSNADLSANCGLTLVRRV